MMTMTILVMVATLEEIVLVVQLIVVMNVKEMPTGNPHLVLQVLVLEPALAIVQLLASHQRQGLALPMVVLIVLHNVMMDVHLVQVLVQVLVVEIIALLIVKEGVKEYVLRVVI
ncbi:MAG: hypothetical protein J1E37_06885 [Prevotella sp.]|nr:hypothetical protein [Prevotella sp.]